MASKEILNKIRNFADKAHGDQKRKYTPERYIVHPVRVMETLKNYTDDMAILAAALLHDVLEDTKTSKDDIYEFLITILDWPTVQRTIDLVIELTDVFTKEDYPQWNRRKRKAMELERVMKTGSDAQTIKYADILDNCNEIVSHDRHFANVFLHECKKLLEVMDKGNKDLHKKTKELVENRIKELMK